MKTAKLSGIVAAVYLGMRFIFPIVLPFFIALVLARFLYPAARWLEVRWNVGKGVSRSAVYGVFLLGIAAVFAGILYGCYRMGSGCLEQAARFIDFTGELFGRCCDRLEQMTGFETEEIRRTVNKSMGDFGGGAVKYSKDAGCYMLGFLAKLVVTFVAGLLILNDYEKLVGGWRKTRPGRYVIDMLRDIKGASGAYLRAQLLIMGIVTVICAAGLWLLETKHALWLGIAVGFCDALPFLGTGTVFVPWALVDVLLGEYKKAAGHFLLYLVCSLVRQILEPRLVGKKLGVPSLAVLMSIYIGIQVYGASGVLLGPISALIIYELCKNP